MGGDRLTAMLTQTGIVISIICNKHGQEMFKYGIRDVAIIPKGMFNLFSVTKMIEEAWKLGGDQYSPIISKGSCQIKFNIIILFAIYY